MHEVTMPKLSDTMEVGKIIAWRVKEGDEVHEGDVLAEVESDKAVMELECFRDGVITSILHGNEAEAPVGEVIALITVKGEQPADDARPTPADAAKPPAAGVAQPPSAVHGVPKAKASEAPAPEKPKPPTPKPTPAPVRDRGPAISPYARKIATGRGIDWTRLHGSGPNGRIVARDVEKAAAGIPSGPTTPARSADEDLPPIEVTEEEADVRPAPFRLRTLARRVTASKHVIPHFYVTGSVDAARLLEKKDELKVRFGATVTHLVILACLQALAEHPDINRSYDRGNIINWKSVNLGIAIDTDQGLTVAVLRDSQELTLEQIVQRLAPLVQRARSGKLTADERRHPTFTISNLGMFGVESFQPIVNPPSAVTLAVAAALPAPVVRGDAFYVSRVMKLTASCDHRIIDGVAAARFLADLTRLLENPDTLLPDD